MKILTCSKDYKGVFQKFVAGESPSSGAGGANRGKAKF